jgi:xanthine dehydrogenase accessory factor
MTADAESVVDEAAGWLEGGARVALATVTQTWSSSPRPAGSQMAIDDRGRFEGSVSGGCVEAAVVEAGLDFLATGKPRTIEFGVSNERAWEVGLACGGRVEVFVGGADRDALREIARLREERATFGIAIDLESGKTDVFRDGDVPEALRSVWGELASAADGGTQVLEAGADRARTFMRVERPPVRIVVIGAVHLTQVLAQLAKLSAFDVVVIDPRAAFASAARFPDVEVVCEWPDRAFERVALDRRTAVVALSHDPKLDEPALGAALRSPAFHVGALGSKKTQASRRRRLAGAGFSEADLDRISGPVGLDIGAKTTAEIAISIMAEIIARRRGA